MLRRYRTRGIAFPADRASFMRRFLTAAALAAFNGATGCVGVKTYLDQRFTPPGADAQAIARKAAGSKPARDAVIPAGGQTTGLKAVATIQFDLGEGGANTPNPAAARLRLRRRRARAWA